MSGIRHKTNRAAGVKTPAHPLVVDLDGTACKGNCLWETLIHAVCHHPWQLLKAAATLPKGKAAFKHTLAETAGIDGRLVPPRQEILDMVATASAEGRQCVLCTASPLRWAAEFNQQNGNPFHVVLGSSPEINLRGQEKATELQARYPQFDYIGDSSADIPVWHAAHKRFLAGNCQQTIRNAKAAGIELELVPSEETTHAWGKTLRVHQWPKNLLVFVPTVAAHTYTQPKTLGLSIAAFCAFCLVASGNYLVNDLLDTPDDRAHPEKRHRGLAACHISIPQGISSAIALLLAGLAVAFATGISTGICLLGYLGLAWIYNHKGKQIPILDTTILATLYCVRIQTGSAATAIPPSNWLVASALFLFFSLALGKRDAELARQPQARGYNQADKATVAGLGTGSGLIAAAMLCLYISSDAAHKLYGNSPLLWILPAVGIYWISRFWLLCGRGQIHEDPVLWALRDHTSWICLSLLILTLLITHAIH